MYTNLWHIINNLQHYTSYSYRCYHNCNRYCTTATTMVQRNTLDGLVDARTYLFLLRRWCWSCATGAPRSHTALPGTRSCPESGSAWGWRHGAGTATWTTCLQAEPYRRPTSRIPHRLTSHYCTTRAAVKLQLQQHSCGMQHSAVSFSVIITPGTCAMCFGTVRCEPFVSAANLQFITYFRCGD